MDLDKIKTEWKQLDDTSYINEDKIKKMVANKGKSALSKLIRLELIGLIVAILCIGVPVLHNYVFTEKIGYTPFLKCFYWTFCVIAFGWQFYKLNFLRKINLDKSDILTCSKQILRYRRFLTRELLGGIIIVIVFMAMFGLNAILIVPAGMKVYFAVYIGFITLVGLLALLWFYKATYKKYIKNIEQSLDEIKDFEEVE